MITIKSQREIELMAKAGHIVALVFEGLKDKIRPGLSTQDIADIAELYLYAVFVSERLLKEGATAAYGQYPA